MHVQLSVGVDAGAQKQSCEFERSRLRRHDRRPGAFCVSIQTIRIHVDRRVQRGAAPPIPQMRIGPALEQELCGVECEIVDGHDQRRHTVGVRLVDIRAGVQQRLHAIRTSRARRIEQRCQAAGRAILIARLAGHLARPVVGQRPGIDVRLMLDEKPRQLG